MNRDNDERIGEKIFSVVPFITKIESASVGLVMLDQAIKYCQSSQTEKKTDIYSNSDMLRYAASI